MLFVEFLAQDGDWDLIAEHVSDGVDQSSFTFVEYELPSAARYDGCESASGWTSTRATTTGMDAVTISTIRRRASTTTSAPTRWWSPASHPPTTVGATDSGIDDS